MALAVVALIGSPNVGKSTIFNRIIGRKRSIVDDQAGITRDRLYETTSWLGKSFRLIDTGGIEVKNRPFQEQIRMQAEIAIEEADIIVFIGDGKRGLTSDDRLIANMLHKAKKKTILAVNKVDNFDMSLSISEFYALGLGEPIPTSGEHGIGIGDILDKIVSYIPDEVEQEYKNQITFSLIGRPNVGKSSFINALYNQKIAYVGKTAGKTRMLNFFDVDGKYTMVDVPGYGYANRSNAELIAFGEMMDNYFSTRDALKLVVMIVDIRHKPTKDDIEMMEFLRHHHMNVMVVANKSDKLSYSKSLESKKLIAATLGIDANYIYPVSSLKKDKIDIVRNIIEDKMSI